jgi:sortase A
VRVKVILAWSQYLLLIAGFCALGYCAIVTCALAGFQARARERLQKSGPFIVARSVAPNPVRPTRALLEEDSGLALVGRVEVPRIHLSAMVAEGSSSRVLRLAVGHVPGTALPWQHGNVGLVAHRDTFFRRLGELHTSDLIRLAMPEGEYTYRVTFTDVVNPNETWVLQPATGNTLTLVTCYPFHFVGPAPERFVVRARKVGSAAAPTER